MSLLSILQSVSVSNASTCTTDQRDEAVTPARGSGVTDQVLNGKHPTDRIGTNLPQGQGVLWVASQEATQDAAVPGELEQKGDGKRWGLL